jgi:DNA-binding Xre family transcriptional regulator
VLRLKVKEVAEKKQVSMHKLSQQAQISYNIVRRLFNNPYQIVNTDTLGRLVDALDCEVEEIIERVKNDEAREDT